MSASLMIAKRIWPISSRLSQRLNQRDISDVASKTVTFDEGREWSARPLIHLPDELDKITGHHSDSNPESNLRLIDCDKVPQGPTQGFLLRDAVVAHGTVLTAGWLRHIRHEPRRAFLPKIGDRYDEAALSSSAVSERYFGHWLRDQLPLEILIGKLGQQALAVPGTVRPNEKGYRDLTNLEAEKPAFASIDKLWIYHDFEITDHRVARINELRSRIRSNSQAAKSSDIVFLGRGDRSVGRSMINESEIAEALSADGVTYLLPEKMEPAEIAGHLKDARIVMGPEGSAFAHALCAMPEGATMLHLIGPSNFTLHYRIYCEALGMKLAIAIGDQEGADRFSFKPDHIRRTMDLILGSS